MILFNHSKLFLCICVCVSSLYFLAEPLLADSYYVATNGNNSNYGDFSNPWKTIEYGVSDVQSGDTLYIREGTYHEKFSVSNIRGDESNPIIISGYPGERPVIDGEHLVPGLWHTLLLFENTEYIIFQNIEVVNSRGSGIRIDENSHHITFHNIWLHSTGYDGIESNNSNYLTVEDSRFWNTNIVNDINSSWYEFFMWGGAIMASGDPDSTIAPAHDIVIRRNEIFQNYGEGINIFGHVSGAIIEDNTFWDNWAPSIFTPNSENILISGNFIYQTNDPRFLREGNPGTGIAFLNEPPPTRPGTMRNITVINNLVMGCNRNIAFWNDEVGGPLQNVLFAHNILIDAHSNTGEEEHSIFISDAAHENVRFENNIILQEDISAGFGYADDTGVSFSHNLWYPGKPPETMQSSNDIYQNPLVLRRGSTKPVELVFEYFKIDKNSPAIGAGIYLPEVTEDFLGAVRPGSPAIGAFEYYEILGASTLGMNKDKIYIAAHRGGYENDYEDKAPENSISNIQNAINHGFDIYESDVERTADGKFIIMHDPTIDRTTNGSGEVAKMTSEELKNYHLTYVNGEVSTEKIPLLDEFISKGDGRIIFKIDYKPELKYLNELIEQIVELKLQNRVILRFIYKKEIVKVLANYDSEDIPIILFRIKNMAQFEELKSTFNPKMISIFARKEFTQEQLQIIDLASKENMLIEAHTFNNNKKDREEYWAKQIELPITIFHTNRPILFQEFLKKQKLR